MNIFNGRFGFLELYQPNGYDASVLLHDLGTAFRGEMLSYKPYPCGRPLHPAIDAALAARAQLKIEWPEDIASVTIEADPAGHSDQFERGPTKRRPTQVVEAQFAQPFLVATALVYGNVGIAEVDGLGDASVLSLSDRIVGVARDYRPRGSLSITVKRTDGRSVTVEATDPIGSPEKPLYQCSARGQVPRLRAKCGAAAVRCECRRATRGNREIRDVTGCAGADDRSRRMTVIPQRKL